MPEPPVTQSRPKGLISCELCQHMILPAAMEKHVQSCHSPEAELQALMKSALRLPFVLLPPSKGGLRNAIESYTKLSHAHSHSLDGARFNWERLEQIESLDPSARYVGVKLWKGYVAFEFQHSDKVVLECPQTGNATYILIGDWRKMISATKAELRSEYSTLCTRIIHVSDWKSRVRQTVFGNPRALSWTSPNR